MNRIQSISDFFEQTDTRLRVFDLGRRIRKVPLEDFRRFESGEAAWPWPLQQQAWLGILGVSDEQPDEHFIWFVRLPLDETAHILEAARDDFVNRLAESLAAPKVAAVQGEEEVPDPMRDNPFGFSPRQDRMADFHARISRVLGKEPSQYYTHARDYLAGGPGWDQWAFVGLQGLADVAARLEEEDNSARVAGAIPHLPEHPYDALCKSLENAAVDTAIAEALAARIRGHLSADDTDPNLIATGLRGISGAPASGLRREVLVEVLDSPYGAELEVLAAIAGRCWEDLHDERVGRAFTEALAKNRAGQEAFNQVMADLLYIPGMREALLMHMRSAERSPELARAIGAMFEAYNS